MAPNSILKQKNGATMCFPEVWKILLLVLYFDKKDRSVRILKTFKLMEKDSNYVAFSDM